MRAFNESGKGPVQFTGFDSHTPDVAAEIVRAFAAKNDPGYELKLRDAIKLAVAAEASPEFGSTTAIERTVPMPDPAGVDARQTAAVAWDMVVGYLETFRESYLNKGASPRDIDWAIQNARVVFQAMQMKSNPAVRDKSMATNIRWIADQNPGSKIVVWAHNGQVGKSASMFPPMGQFLQELFPGKVVTFGFAFNQGGFQAFERGKGKRNFTVPPMVPGSLDATLAATGIPVFALDLRDAPAWYSEARKSRSIGAVFSDAIAANLVVDLQAKATFDALFFVEKTTPAKPIQH